ncbi:hypothetical protein T484DRAFT_1790702 [Baffinella frigidus]|nr:hypothetical protein T484DRAFT_1790702 [Cryptophyta sp. CCMP2293]
MRVLVHARFEDWPKMLTQEQLLQQIGEKKAFTTFCEAPISFPPTFKYDPNTSTYDTSKKQRTPAYCDRVLFRNRLPAGPGQYRNRLPAGLGQDAYTNTCTYDTAKRQRTPAYCDRVLYRNRLPAGPGQGLHVEAYERGENRESDHRPHE